MANFSNPYKLCITCPLIYLGQNISIKSNANRLMYCYTALALDLFCQLFSGKLRAVGLLVILLIWEGCCLGFWLVGITLIP